MESLLQSGIGMVLPQLLQEFEGGHEAGCELKGEGPVDPFETLDKRFAPYTIPIVFPRSA